MRELLAGGEVEYAYVGITTDDLTPALARFLLGTHPTTLQRIGIGNAYDATN